MQIDPAFAGRLERLIAEGEAALSAGGSLPYEAMFDPDISRFETREIFERATHAVCHSSQVREPGAKWIGRIGSVPVLVVRGRDGLLRGFVNVCRHRGYPVATDTRCTKRLVCRYHAWSYDLDGALVGAPEVGRDFDRSSLGLKPVSVAEERGIVFASARCDVEAGCLPGLREAMARTGFDLSGYRHFDTIELEPPTDWKLLYDNTVECYHCASIHAYTLTRLYETRGFQAAEWDGPVRVSRATLVDGGAGHTCIQAFPGTYLTMDPMIGIVGRFEPVAADRSRLTFNLLRGPAAEEAEAARFRDVWLETLKEDHAVLGLQAQGIASGTLAGGRLMAGPESCLVAVQRLVIAAYRTALSRA